MQDGIYNAKVEKVKLEFEDHGCLCLNLYLEHEGGYQTFGGINLISKFQKEFKPDGGNYAGWYIKRVFDVCGVDSMDELPGQAVRIKLENGIIRAIGNIIRDDWFEPRVDFKKD